LEYIRLAEKNKKEKEERRKKCKESEHHLKTATIPGNWNISSQLIPSHTAFSLLVSISLRGGRKKKKYN